MSPTPLIRPAELTEHFTISTQQNGNEHFTISPQKNGKEHFTISPQ